MGSEEDWIRSRELLARGFEDLSADLNLTVSQNQQPQIRENPRSLTDYSSWAADGPLQTRGTMQLLYSRPSPTVPDYTSVSSTTQHPSQYPYLSQYPYPSRYPYPAGVPRPMPPVITAGYTNPPSTSLTRVTGSTVTLSSLRPPRSVVPAQMRIMTSQAESQARNEARNVTGPAAAAVTTQATVSSSYYAEHRRLFGHGSGYKPSHSAMAKGKGPKSKYSGKAKQNPRLVIWKKEVMCLQYKDAKKVPDTTEKIALAKLGLTVKEVKFDLDGDIWHFDSILKEAFPELQFTGGYTLLRARTASSLVVIDPPKGGFNIRYLKDILQSARLYVRPLQNDIEGEVLQQAEPWHEGESEQKDADEPYEFCNVCDSLLPITDLRKHVEECKKRSDESFGNSSSTLRSDESFGNSLSTLRSDESFGNSLSTLRSDESFGNSSSTSRHLSDTSKSELPVAVSVENVIGENFESTLQVLFNNSSTVKPVLDLMRENLIDEVEDPPRILVEKAMSLDDWAESALVFYKSTRFVKSAEVRLSIKGDPGIDAGGIRRDFFSRVFEKFASGYLGIFEGRASRIRPSYAMTILASGTLKSVGTMIAHAMVIDEIPFPFLSPPLYYYMADQLDVAVTLIMDDDISNKIKYITKLLRNSDNFAEQLQDVAELIDQCGASDIPFKVEHKEEIIQSLIFYDVLLKRKVFIDSFIEGLNVYSIGKLLKMKPKLFEPMFTYHSKLGAADVKNIISTEEPPGTDIVKLQLLKQIGAFLDECTEAELRNFLIYCTGSPEVIGNNITIVFSEASELSVNTCLKTINISKKINPPRKLAEALGRLIVEPGFTMP